MASEIRRRNMSGLSYPSAKMSPTKKYPSGGLSPTANQKALSGACVTAEEANAILQQLADLDDDRKKTWSRIVVDKYLSKYNWYWPKRPNRPDLLKAWTYFEHVTLPRHFVGENTTDYTFRRAEPGEHQVDTELYDPFRTPQKAFVEWGAGVDLYFISVLFFTVFMFVAACINIPSMIFYINQDYNNGVDKNNATDALTGMVASLPFSLEASAICTNAQWVVCTDCTYDDWRRDPSRFARGVASDGTPVTLVVRNTCQGTQFDNAFTNYATLLFAFVFIALTSLYLRARGVRFDEDKVTTTDYSVNVKNPPPDAYDPDEWHDFFSQFATDGDQVTCVTVTLNNEPLLRKTFYYRNFRGELLRKIPADTDTDDEQATNAAIEKFLEEGRSYYIEFGFVGWILQCMVIPLFNIFGMLLSADKLYARMLALKEEIKELQEKEYKVSQIFVTFETEEGQRTALSALKVGLGDLLIKNKHAVSTEALFRGTLLEVVQPAEPNAVRWLDLDDKPVKIFIRSFITLVMTLGMIAFAGICIFYARQDIGPFFAGILTTLFNSTIPQAIKLLMMIEPHQTEGGYQVSLYLKITIFRWALTAIVPLLITPHTSTLGSLNSDLIPTIRGILLSECWLSPLLRVSDYMTNAKKHLFAPRAENEEDMILWFQGTFYNLGERYTDLTKILFVVFFYSAIYPFGFVMGFIILAGQYAVDKFSLFRLWGWNPSLGADLANFSWKYMVTAALVTFAVASSYVFAQFPYDNLCDPPEGDLVPIPGNGTFFNVTYNNGELIPTSIAPGQLIVKQQTQSAYCNQLWSAFSGVSFPATARIQGDGLTWFSASQDRVTLIYGWTAVAIVIVTVLYVFSRTFVELLKSLFTGVYQPEGESQNIDFSSNPEIYGYVPQLKFGGHPFPYLCCDIDDIDQGLIGWNDASHSYDYYNLMFEIPHRSMRRTKRIEMNTRYVATIADAEEYQDVADSGTELGHRVMQAGKRKKHLYSVVKHYPTTWQIDLANKLNDQEP